AIERVGGRPLAQKRARTGFDPKCPVSGRDGSRRKDALERPARYLWLIASSCSFEQLDGRPDSHEQLRRVLAGGYSGCQRLLIAAEPIEQDRARPMCVLDRRSLPPCGELLDGVVDQPGSVGLPALEAGEHQSAVGSYES